MPSPGSIVRLTSGEIAVVTKVTPLGLDDQVEVIRDFWNKPVVKRVRITIDQIQEVIEEAE